MGKKKPTANAAENLKGLGNKAFQDCNFTLAIDFYSQAIEKSSSPNHIYFANRANVFLEIGEDQKCLEDCLKAI
jgi:tetratricopeptide (TPR) repeat protein